MLLVTVRADFVGKDLLFIYLFLQTLFSVDRNKFLDKDPLKKSFSIEENDLKFCYIKSKIIKNKTHFLQTASEEDPI